MEGGCVLSAQRTHDDGLVPVRDGHSVGVVGCDQQRDTLPREIRHADYHLQASAHTACTLSSKPAVPLRPEDKADALLLIQRQVRGRLHYKRPSSQALAKLMLYNANTDIRFRPNKGVWGLGFGVWGLGFG